MMGTRITTGSFNPNEKMDWFNADLNGLIFTWVASVVLCIVLWLVIGGITTIDVADYTVRPFANMISTLLGDYTFGLIILLSMVPAFVIVFVFRYNFTVIGPRRQFRYLCRWL